MVHIKYSLVFKLFGLFTVIYFYILSMLRISNESSGLLDDGINKEFGIVKNQKKRNANKVANVIIFYQYFNYKRSY